MKRDARGGPDGPLTARLRLHRGPAAMYAVVALVLIVVLVLSIQTWLVQGRFAFAVASVLIGLFVVGFLGLLTVSIVVPGLVVTERGVAGRVRWGSAVDLGWSAVVVDVTDDDRHGRFRVDLAGDPVIIDQRTWRGFADFVLVVASTPAAARRLTPAGRDEVLRLLAIAEPAVEDDDASTD